MRTAFKCVRVATCGASSAVHCWQSSSTAATALAGRMAAVALLYRSQKCLAACQCLQAKDASREPVELEPELESLSSIVA